MHQYTKYRCCCEWIYSLLIQWNLNVKLGIAVWHYSAPTRSFSRASLEMHVKLYFIVLVVIVFALLWTIAVQCCCFSFSCFIFFCHLCLSFECLTCCHWYMTVKLFLCCFAHFYWLILMKSISVCSKIFLLEKFKKQGKHNLQN